MIRIYHHISKSERDLITVWKAQGKSNREIGRRLGYHHTTVGRELKRNRLAADGLYVAIYAQAKRDKRQQTAKKRHPLRNQDLYAYVMDKLKDGWSPELISGRLRKVEHPDDPDWSICHETIYRYIYSDQAKAKFPDNPLWEYLPRKQKRRKKRSDRKVHKSRIPQRISIHKRPEEVNNKIEFGHWEADSVEGRKSDGDGIHTEAERITNFYAAVKVNAITSLEALRAQKEIFGDLPPQARRSTTLDNGRENHLHFKLRDELGMETFFCDPYSSWQRGCNEHHNGLLRRYLPKRTSFKELTQEELDDMVWEINNRPRKWLGYNTPQEAFERELKNARWCTSK